MQVPVAFAVVGEQQREPVEQGQVEREAQRTAPGGEYLGEGRREHGRRGQPTFLGPIAQAFPGIRVELELTVGEPRPVHGDRRAAQRQVRWRRQRLGSGCPVLEGSLGARGIGVALQGEDVVAERHVDRRELVRRVLAECLPLAEQHRHAGQVHHQQVEADVQPVRSGEPGDADVEQRPLGGVVHAVGHLGPDLREAAIDIVRRRVRQVDDVDREPGNLWQHPLIAVLADDGTEHAVPGDEPVPRVGQHIAVQPPALELEIGVRRDVSQDEVRPASDPVGILDLGERKRAVAVATGRFVRALDHRTAFLTLCDTSVPEMSPAGQHGGRGGHGTPSRLLPRTS